VGTLHLRRVSATAAATAYSQSIQSFTTVSQDRVWQVRLPNDTVWIPADSRPDDPRASWIYSREMADIFARDAGGTVVEVPRRQKDKVLDQEIAVTLAAPRTASKKTAKTRSRPFSRAAQRAIATAILESVPLSYPARSALDTARETAADAEYKAAIKALKAGLPGSLWVGYDNRLDQGFAQDAEPVWITDDPQGEDPGQWRQIMLDEIASLLVEAA